MERFAKIPKSPLDAQPEPVRKPNGEPPDPPTELPYHVPAAPDIFSA